MMPRMKVVFRADASLQMGTGHVMRCLTLADALMAQGAECQFICREHPGNLIEHIKHKGYRVHVLAPGLPVGASVLAIHATAAEPQLAHAAWLGATQQQDADACTHILRDLQPDWLIVDHYALDARWEETLQPYYFKLMVIDDLADRRHECELLLDQTFARNAADYRPWVPATCTVLCGSQYALLRPEFAALRPRSLQRRAKPQLQQLLITMGGVDKDNATGAVLTALQFCELPADCRIIVVVGATAPWLAKVRQQAEQLPWATEVRVNVSDMAQLMADSDLAIGAAGATSWERCCLGLPTIMVVLAENQQQVARGLEQAGSVYAVQSPKQILASLPALLKPLLSSSVQLSVMSQAAAAIANGNGIATIIQHLES